MIESTSLSKLNLSAKQQDSANLIFEELARVQLVKHMLGNPDQVTQSSDGNLFIRWYGPELLPNGSHRKTGYFTVDEEGFITYLVTDYATDFQACDEVKPEDLFVTILYLSSELT